MGKTETRGLHHRHLYHTWVIPPTACGLLRVTASMERAVPSIFPWGENGEGSNFFHNPKSEYSCTLHMYDNCYIIAVRREENIYIQGNKRI